MALMRGDCPVGGVKVTGYATEASRYCAINWREYTITGNTGAADEKQHLYLQCRHTM